MIRLDVRELAAVFGGGVVGAVARTALVQAVPVAPAHWPWPTFTANVVGAFLLGYFATRLQERLPPSSYRRPLLGTGLCGALTTFSTMQVEILGMLDARAYLLAAAYVLVSIIVGYAAVQLATGLVRSVRVRVRL